MSLGLFRLRTPDGEERLARGDTESPAELLPAELTVDSLLSGPAAGFGERVRTAPSAGAVPAAATLLPPVGSQEIWGAGVTYLRSRDARMEEALDASPYDRVYEAERPELFFKSSGFRVRGPGDRISIRADSTWNVPEPELTLVLAADLGVAGYTLGNDMSSRSIEGENLLYLSQAKIFDGSCAIGPCIVPADEVAPPFDLRLEILRDGQVEFVASTSTARMRRTFDELASYLGRALRFPTGAFMLTGTGIVPEADFTLAVGDMVRISSTLLGALENEVEQIGS